MLQNLKHFIYPDNPVDERVLSRVKRGAIHYAHTGGWSAIPPMQRWLKRQSYSFRHGRNGSSTQVRVSGADLTHLWVADEVLVDNVYALDAVPFAPALVIDFGANIGLFTLLASARWRNAQFVCVEPHPTTFRYLCENLDLNKVPAIKLQCAVETKPGIMFLQNEGAVYQALSSERTATPAITVPPSALIPALSPLLIKMDIEGAEEKVLESLGSSLPQDCFIFIELHRGDAAVAWIRDWAARYHFYFVEVRRRDDAIDGYLSRVEARPKA